MNSGEVIVNFKQANIHFSAVDYGFAYVANTECANERQAGVDGMIYISTRDMFPFHDSGLFKVSPLTKLCFVTSDPCTSEHKVITNLHIIFPRGHNLLSNERKESFPSMDIDHCFQTVRKISSAEFQRTVRKEFISMRADRRVHQHSLSSQRSPSLQHFVQFDSVTHLPHYGSEYQHS